MDYLITPPTNWRLEKIDHCCACGIGKKEKNKPKCAVYGSLVNNGRHQYRAFVSPKSLTTTDITKDEE